MVLIIPYMIYDYLPLPVTNFQTFTKKIATILFKYLRVHYTYSRICPAERIIIHTTSNNLL